MKTVGVRELKNRLSAHLRDVSAGEIILVTDRSEVIAELRRPSALAARPPSPSQMTVWAEDGKVRPANPRKKKLGASPVSLREGSAKKLLDLDRGP